MKYISYQVYIICPACLKKVLIESFDYFYNALGRKKSLIESFGKGNVYIKKSVREI